MALLLLLVSLPAAAQDHTATVTAVKASLAGQDLSGPCGAFAITGRVAWELRAEGWGLITKTAGQNGCDSDGGRYAVDALIMLQDGTTIDCLINAETDNTPAWQSTGAGPVTSWRAPFDLDGGSGGGGGGGSTDHDAIVALLGEMQAQAVAWSHAVDASLARLAAEHAAILAKLDSPTVPADPGGWLGFLKSDSFKILATALAALAATLPVGK